MNYKESTGKSIRQAFDEFHKSHPEIYTHFKELAAIGIKSGRKKLSAKLILNVIRWNIGIGTLKTQTIMSSNGSIAEFKLNDAFHAYYGRMFVTDFPQYESLFEFRELRNERKPSPYIF